VLLLAIDTSTTAITAAVHDGHRVLAEAATLDARAHGEQLAPRIAEVLTAAGAIPSDLTDVVVGVGPGPFTGLRVGIVTAATIAYAVGARLHGVCSLDALAYEAVTRGLPVPDADLVVATDARRKEVYWARYALVGPAGIPLTRLDGPHVTKPADLPADIRGLSAVGRGPLLYPRDLTGLPHGPVDVSAGALADLAVLVLATGRDLSSTEPLYLRRPDAAPHVPRKPVTV
jgi:tRNA threonylcarbamoyl adenosine modification protein YeaZ